MLANDFYYFSLAVKNINIYKCRLVFLNQINFDFIEASQKIIIDLNY